eukprot:TRINITY_DN68588_c0_g1_i2.p1 TRINITY_DN68588_c0_g1~~TRINITY_DN68588_c0_g1_i2.p1  ORF type:complete len:140 (-),score=25.15 TRINITY_DN68588_c0_g1_i2:3-422(-)
MIRRPPRSTQGVSSAASDVYKRQVVKGIKDRKIKIGRSHDCDMKINDSSVSRSHSFLSFNGEHFFIEDNNSKFGTLIKAPRELKLEPQVPISIQLGRTVLTLLAKGPVSSVSPSMATEVGVISPQKIKASLAQFPCTLR